VSEKREGERGKKRVKRRKRKEGRGCVEKK
jgi:hypothetical protein